MLSILIVDDQEPFHKLISNHLESEKIYNCEVCESGEEAIKQIAQKNYDLILLDYHMPGISGLNVLQWMYEEKLDTPVIMLTGAGSENIAVEAMKFGAYDYIRKDQLDLRHLSIIINGVHERYLFRKEKEKYLKLFEERAQQLEHIDSFQNTLESLELILKNSISIVSLEIDDFEKNFQSISEDDKTLSIKKNFDNIKEQFNLIKNFFRSFFELTDNINIGYRNLKKSILLEENLNNKSEENKINTLSN